MAKKKEKKQKGVFGLINNVNSYLNGNKFFAGLVMIMLNIGSKYITIKLSKNQESFLRNSIGHQILVFAISWMGTRDIVTALILTAVFTVLTNHLFNEDSMFCIIPKKWQKFEEVLDLNGDGKVDKEEIAQAIKILEKAKNKNK